jgi:hypothetical protein
MTTGPVLRDIHLPAEPSWWPPAPGWWLLAAVLCVGLAWVLRQFARKRRTRTLRRALQAEVDTLRREHTDAAAQVAALSLLLRRAAKRYAPAALTLRDEAWLRFLDADDPAQPFSRGPGRLLLDGPYRPQVERAEAEALTEAVRRRLDTFVPETSRQHSKSRRAASGGDMAHG